MGIITDGDLRRHVKKGILDLKVKQVMSNRPKLIADTELLTGAIKIMNKNKITCLFVVNNLTKKIPVGIIHIHDCLRYAN